MIMAMSLECPNISHYKYFPTRGSSIATALAFNLWFVVYFFMHICNQFYLRNYGSLCGIYNFLIDRMAKNLHVNGRVGKCLSVIILWLYMINLTLITIVNPSILNPGPDGNLSICYQNVQGLIPFSHLKDINPLIDVNKMLELQTYSAQNKSDVVILNETWLKKSIKDNEILPNSQYKMYRSDRSLKTHPPDPLNHNTFRRNGGGVLIAVRTDLNITSREINLGCGAELIAIEFTTSDGRKFIICTCYRVGTLGEGNHDKIVTALRTLLKRKKLSKIFIVGDFNLSCVSWESLEGRTLLEQRFVDSFIDLGLTQCINEPTHVAGNTLDILLTNCEPCIDNLKILDKDSICNSDHFPITFDVKVRVTKNKPSKRKCYNFKKASWGRLNRDLCQTDWNAMLNCCEPEFAWRKFKHRLFELADKHIPKTTIKSEFQPPWFDAECYSSCRKKERLRKKFKNSRNELDGIKFKLARKEFKKLVSQKMRDNLYESDDSTLITKKFWSHVKSVSNSHRIPEFVTYKDQVRNCPQDQANLFNNFFYEQFSNTSKYDITIDFRNDSRFDIDFNHIKIRKLLAKINSNKAQGPDGIHGKLLKNCAVGLAYPLSLIFKITYNTGSIPQEWKLANVVPIFKKGNKHEVCNYRPISLTSLVIKTLERIIKEEILLHVNDSIDERQHGFLSKKSCATNLVGLCDSLAISLNDNIRTEVVYFDFAKAFDSVNHDIILEKLKFRYNIDGRLLKFIANYLENRNQRVVVGNSSSTLKNVKSGVPQGSILGPILFVLFINDITEGLTPGTQISLYADDTKIWRSINYESDIMCLQKDIDYLYDWAIKNKMNFHPKKCKVLSIAISQPIFWGVLPFTKFVYSLGENPLESIETETDLGVIVTSSFNWTEQCQKVYSKANQMLGLAKRTCFFVNDENRRRAIYLSLVRSQFEHCSVIWRPTTKTKLCKFEGLQKRALKWILSEEELSYSSPTTYIKKCRQANVLPIHARFDLLDFLFSTK